MEPCEFTRMISRSIWNYFKGNFLWLITLFLVLLLVLLCFLANRVVGICFYRPFFLFLYYLMWIPSSHYFFMTYFSWRQSLLLIFHIDSPFPLVGCWLALQLSSLLPIVCSSEGFPLWTHSLYHLIYATFSFNIHFHL